MAPKGRASYHRGMDNLEVIKASLDAQLFGRGRNVGIALGVELFKEFRRRGWIKLAHASVLGLPWTALDSPAYGTHFAFPSFDVAEDGFKVGDNA